MTATHPCQASSPPRDPAEAVELPPAAERRLGPDDGRPRVVLTEADRFDRPSFGPRPAARRDASRFALGEPPASLFRRVRDGWLNPAAGQRRGGPS